MPIPLNHSGAGVITLKAPTSGTLTLTLPTADGTNGQVLSTNGSGVLSFVTAGGGGVTGFTSAENTTAPNATVYVDSLTASAASTDADVAFVAKGAGATLAQVPTGTTAGGNKRGTYATDLQKDRQAASQVASGAWSVLGGGYRCTVSGDNAVVVGGDQNRATLSNAFVGSGYNNLASNFYAAVVSGDSNTASGQYAFIGAGSSNTADASFSSVLSGSRGTTRSIISNSVISSSNPIANAVGVSQSALLVLGVQTTNATATILRSNTSAATTTNQAILPNNSAYFFRGEVIAGVTGAGDSKGWTIEGVIKRGSGAGTTALVGTPTVTSLYADTGAATWSITATADTTNGGLAITVTGQASTTIRWVAQIRTTEMTY
jgi:hypothetical protein